MTQAVFPVIALKQQIQVLEAAVLVAVTSTEVGAVHKLRTSIRRVEAHLVLLDLMLTDGNALSEPLPHARAAAAVLRRLRRVRRAAGTVRDLDVQISTIQLDEPPKSAVHKGTPGDTTRKQAKALRRHLEGKRNAQARMLVRVLKAERQQLATELRTLEQALAPVEQQSLTAIGLVDRVAHAFVVRVQSILRPGKMAVPRAVERLSDDSLHNIRKLAKRSRYMLESAPRSRRARAAAERFEVLQEMGGRWHDWLLLQELAGVYHGRKAPLTQRYCAHAVSALAEYQLGMNEMLPSMQQ